MKRQLRKHEELLHLIAENTQRIRKTHSIVAPESILGADSSKESIINKLPDQTIGQEDSIDEIAFESLVLESKVYKKTFNNILRPGEDNEPSDNRMITDVVSSSIVKPGNMLEERTKYWSLWPDAPTWVFDFLDVDETCAQVLCDQLAPNLEGLNIRPLEWVYHIERIDGDRWQGTANVSGREVSTLFNPEDICLYYKLRDQSQVAIAETRSASNFKALCYEKGDHFNISVCPAHI